MARNDRAGVSFDVERQREVEMAVQVSLSSSIPRRPRTVAIDSGTGGRTPTGGRLRPVVVRGARSLWRLLVNAVSGPGLDDSALPSSFEAPYGRGSRQVRSLWHLPF